MSIQIPLLPQVPLAPLQEPKMDTSLRPTGAQYVGAGLTNVGEMFHKAQYAADVMEGNRLTRETSAEMSAAVRQAHLTYADPNEYEQAATDKLNEIKQARLDSASSSYSRQILSDHIGDDMIRHKEQIVLGKFQKYQDIAKGNYLLSKQQLIDEASKLPPDDTENLAGIRMQFGDLLGTMHVTNVFDAEKTQQESQSFYQLVEQTQAEKLIMDNPQQYLSNVKQGMYSHIPTLTKNDLTKNALTMSDRLDKAKDQAVIANQRAAYKTAGTLVDQNKLTFNDIKELENSDAIDATQARTLYGRLGTPIQMTEPGAATDILTRYNLGEISGNRAKDELSKLYQRAPKDPNIGAAIAHIEARQRADTAASNAAQSRQRAEAVRNYEQAVRELDQTPLGNGDYRKRYRDSMIPMTRKKYGDALEEMKIDILDKKMPKEDALKKAQRRLAPQSVPTRSDKVTDFTGE